MVNVKRLGRCHCLLRLEHSFPAKGLILSKLKNAVWASKGGLNCAIESNISPAIERSRCAQGTTSPGSDPPGKGDLTDNTILPTEAELTGRPGARLMKRPG